MGADRKKPILLASEKCNGCVTCMKRCPTEAIRVRNGKAAVAYERCIACGECVKVCPTNAKSESFDSFLDCKDYKYKVAVVSPSIFGQFGRRKNLDSLIESFKSIGFDDVFEVSVGADATLEATDEYIKNNKDKGCVISSKCPAVKGLILMRYEHLIKNLSPIIVPELAAAKIALKETLKKTGLQRQDIGIVVVTQCAAQVKELTEDNAKEYIDKVISIKEIYFDIFVKVKKTDEVKLKKVSRSSRNGSLIAVTGGEIYSLRNHNCLMASGLDEVISVLNALENDKMQGVDFLELNACSGGCTGGSQNIENPFLAASRLKDSSLKQNLKKGLKKSKIISKSDLFIDDDYIGDNIYRLDEDRATALKMALKINQIYDTLPKIDCGACGAPTCKALAEDIVKGLKVRCLYKKDDLLR